MIIQQYMEESFRWKANFLLTFLIILLKKAVFIV